MKTRTFVVLGFLASIFSVNTFAAINMIWTVTGTGDAPAFCSGTSCPTLRSAIAAAGSFDAIRFSTAIDGQTILLTQSSNASTGTEFGPSAFYITGNLTLTIDGETGLVHGITIARDPNQAAFRLFDVASGSNLHLQGLTLMNGLAQGFSSGAGGGALGAGGAIFNQGTLDLVDCTLAGNAAVGGSSGDGSGNYSGAGVGSAPSGGNGGGPNGSSVYGGSGGFGGGGIAYDQGSNGGFGGGGGSGGSGGGGGFGAGAGGASGSGSADGGYGGGGNNATTAGGGGAGMGGAIFNDAGTLNIINSTFTANSATGGRGGAVTAGNGSGFGGAIFNYAGNLSIVYATLARNDVASGSTGTGGTYDGGALYSLSDAAVVCGGGSNACPTGGTATLALQGSIFSNTLTDTDDVAVVAKSGATTSFGTVDGLIIMNYVANQLPITNFRGSADPLLSPLGHHGGWTPVMVPYRTSAAVNAIACIAGTLTDQRGVSRPYPSGGQCDIGAVEYDGDYIFGNGFDY